MRKLVSSPLLRVGVADRLLAPLAASSCRLADLPFGPRRALPTLDRLLRLVEQRLG